MRMKRTSQKKQLVINDMQVYFSPEVFIEQCEMPKIILLKKEGLT